MRDSLRDAGNTPQDCHAGVGKLGHFCTNSHASLAQHSRGGGGGGARQTYIGSPPWEETLACSALQGGLKDPGRKHTAPITRCSINTRQSEHCYQLPCSSLQPLISRCHQEWEMESGTCSSEPEFITMEHHTFYHWCFCCFY